MLLLIFIGCCICSDHTSSDLLAALFITMYLSICSKNNHHNPKKTILTDLIRTCIHICLIFIGQPKQDDASAVKGRYSVSVDCD